MSVIEMYLFFPNIFRLDKKKIAIIVFSMNRILRYEFGLLCMGIFDSMLPYLNIFRVSLDRYR